MIENKMVTIDWTFASYNIIKENPLYGTFEMLGYGNDNERYTGICIASISHPEKIHCSVTNVIKLFYDERKENDLRAQDVYWDEQDQY